MTSTPIMTVMIAAVRKAARGVQRDFGEVSNLQVSVKGPGNFVTNADKRVEKILREELAKARPSYGVLGEEDGEVKGQDPDHRFIIDPIDGTTNFMHALPLIALNVALERKGEIVAAVTYNPVMDELYHAEKGTGAFLNNKRLRVSGRRDLGDAIIATALPHRGAAAAPHEAAELQAMQKATSGIRTLGSTAVEMAWVAAGRLDGVWSHGLNPWDVAAGILLIREAGGFVAPLGEGSNPLTSTGFVGTNADLLPQMQKLLAAAKA